MLCVTHAYKYLLQAARKVAAPLANPRHVAILEELEVCLEGARKAHLQLRMYDYAYPAKLDSQIHITKEGDRKPFYQQQVSPCNS